MNDLETLGVRELQEILINLGMPEEDVAQFRTKAPLISTINVMRGKTEVTKEEETEVKKVASLEEKPNPAEDREINRMWKTKAIAMQDKLSKQPKVSILIPLEPAEKAGVVEERTDKQGRTYQAHVGGAIETVQLNGFKYMIPKGKYVPVPQQIAEIISRSQQQTLEAGSNISMDRIDPKTGRPMNEVI